MLSRRRYASAPISLGRSSERRVSEALRSIVSMGNVFGFGRAFCVLDACVQLERMDPVPHHQNAKALPGTLSFYLRVSMTIWSSSGESWG